MNFGKKCSLFLTLVCFTSAGFAQKPIGNYTCGHQIHQTFETNKKAAGVFDVRKYSITLNITDFDNQQIHGYTDVEFEVLKATSKIVLSFEGMTVDSVMLAGNHLTFNRSGGDLEIEFLNTLVAKEIRTVRVYYGGKPIKDASWGGFYFSGEYAFNLGVGFTSAPHNYGRIWFPCVDNFTDRAVYDFNITCPDNKIALCNGVLTNETAHGNGTKTFNWEMNDPIPTYLASVAVAPYTFSQWLHESGVPVVLSAVAADSLNMAKSFVNLNKCIDAYIAQYGPHTFDRIGFNLVPFNGGAMEHATNIAYPRFGADGALTYETLYAHELGHHWWGNTVTCRTPEDMWINEGWASFSERVFLEWVYGKKRYDDDISSNHKAVLHYAHLRDGDTLPVSGIGHTNTYGMHVYDKGADMVHTLRGYMGDTAFFDAIRYFMVDYKFKDVSTQDLENHFQKYTPQDLSYFFNNWIYNPGFPHFEILGYTTEKNGEKYKTVVDVKQRLRHAPDYFDYVPMDLSLYSSINSVDVQSVELFGKRQSITVTTDEKPVYIALDFNKRISDAITDDYAFIMDTGLIDLGDAMMTLKVTSSSGSSLIRVEHHWVGADAYFVNEGSPFLSRERYWTVDGIWDSGFKADATIEYFGRKTGTNYALGYLDVDLIRNTEEGMVLMYRPNASVNWEECSDYEWEMGSKFDKRGAFTIHNVQKGQYCFGIKDDSRLSVQQVEVSTDKYVSVYPNPANKVLNIDIEKAKNAMIEITDGSGRLIFSDKVTSKKCHKTIDVSAWSSGIYYVGIVMNGQPYQPVQVFVK